jgi:cysteine-rich repeat protein
MKASRSLGLMMGTWLVGVAAVPAVALVHVRAVPSPSVGGGDAFGYAISPLGGDSEVLVSAVLGPLSGPCAGAGAVYPVDVTSGALGAPLLDPTPALLDVFGVASRLVGSAVLVSAPLDDDGTTNAGVVHVFDAATASLLATFTRPGGPAEVGFGWALAAVDGDALVGAVSDGAVYRLALSTGLPVVTYADPDAASGAGGFGSALATGGGRVFVGARDREAGRVYVFDADTGTHERTLAPSEIDASGFGFALAVVGDRLLVGAPWGTTAGMVEVFDVATGASQAIWLAPGGASSAFGLALAPLGGDVLVGSPGQDLEPGEVHRIDVATGAVVETLENPNPGIVQFGSAIASLAGTAVVGAAGDVLTPGAVHVFTPCGDGTAQPGEECDDGNTAGADGCSATCEIEATTTTSTTSTTTTTTTLPPDPATIAPALDAAVATTVFAATEFIYSGPDPIQRNVVPGTISRHRAGLLHGEVRDGAGGALGGVRVSIHDRPEFGETLSRADGRFDLVVNGGETLGVVYEKPGHLTAHRRVDVPWQEYVLVPSVTLLQLSSVGTEIDLTAPGVQVARGPVESDDDGVRQATLLFAEGTEAVMRLPGGGTSALSTLTVRATEYTVGDDGPDAMPAPLPPHSAYTYAVELSVDEALAAGAASVEFSKPVGLYVENFLGFTTGSVVPAGYYDRIAGQWVPSDNGRVIRVVGTTGGLADLDVDGDGLADEAPALAALGIDAAERATVASLYSAGQSLWRVPIPHFSPWDLNWPVVLPEDAEPPDAEEPDSELDEDDFCAVGGSIIGCQTQTLSESIPITGTPFRLNYHSDRVRGRRSRRRLDIPLSGQSIPASVQRIELKVTAGGKTTTTAFPAVVGQTHPFEWDGLDRLNRPLQGEHAATIRLGYVYNAEYADPATDRRARVRPPRRRIDIRSTSDRTRPGAGAADAGSHVGRARIRARRMDVRRSSRVRPVGEASLLGHGTLAIGDAHRSGDRDGFGRADLVGHQRARGDTGRHGRHRAAHQA